MNITPHKTNNTEDLTLERGHHINNRGNIKVVFHGHEDSCPSVTNEPFDEMNISIAFNRKNS